VPEAKKWLAENKNFYHKSALAKIEKIVNNGAENAAAYAEINKEDAK